MGNEDKQNEEQQCPNAKSIESQKNDSAYSVNYPYSEWMLEEIKGEYAVENERENLIGTKASAFITVIVAIIALYIPLIPFDKLKAFLGANTTLNYEKTLTIIFLIVLGAGLVSLLTAFIFLLKAYGVKGYNRVKIDDLLTLSGEMGGENSSRRSQIAQGITAHYHKILRGTVDQEGNMKINSDSADFVSKGIEWTVVGFVILSVATIALRVIVV